LASTTDAIISLVDLRPEIAGELQALQTQRLRLAALTRPGLAALHTGPRALEAVLALKLARGLLADSERRAVARKLAQMQAAPEAEHAWYTYWLALAVDATEGIGLVGFKGPPDPDGVVELAYSIAPRWQRQGYATEAAGALVAWAFGHPRCRAIIAPDTLRANAASSRVLEKLGMRVVAATPRTRSWRLDRA
jgi:RimJ/RimL family protein N-acetyltransferase